MCLLAASRVQLSVGAGNGWPHNALRHHCVCNAGRHSPSSDLLHSLHWLPVRHRTEFKTATLCFKSVKLDTPSYLNNMLKPYAPPRALRSSNMDLLTVPRTDTSLSLRCCSVARPQVWNRLPHELRQCNTISSFKSNLKTYYFRRHMDNRLAPCLVAPPIAF